MEKVFKDLQPESNTSRIIQQGILEEGETFKWVQFEMFNFTFYGRNVSTVGISKQGN